MLHRHVRLAVVSTAAAGLVAGGVASAAIAAPRAHHAARASVTTYKATIKHKKLTLTGPSTVPAGLVTVSLHSVDNEYELGILSFKHGYNMRNFKHDLGAFEKSAGRNGPSKAGLRHYRNALKHTFGYGGLDVTAKKTGRATILLNRPGTVYIFNDSGNLPVQIHKVKVTGTTPLKSVPTSGPVVKAQQNRRFGGANKLPANGTITVKNTATSTLAHMLFLQHVKKGTTRKQVIDGLMNNDFSFARPGSAGTDVLTRGESQTLTYKVPAGTYAEICFIPDPSNGEPHAFMGMVKIVHLS